MDHEHGPAGDDGHHSHSRIRKILDEIDAVLTAALWNGTFEAHHRQDLENFVERLREIFEDHAEYEEEGIFEEMRPMLDDDGLEQLEVVIDQHRKFSDHLDRVESLFDELEVGASADDEPLRRLDESVDKLQELWSQHDASERKLFEHLPEEAH